MVRAPIEPKFDTVRARLLVMLLAFAQPLVRGFSRYFTWLRFKRTPANVIRRHEHLPERAPLRRQPEPPGFLERAGQGSSLFPGGNLSAARRRRLALFNRQRVERVGHSNLRKFLVEHSTSNRHGIPRRRKMFDPCSASQPFGHHHNHS